jgi:hypothetical protein
LPVSSGHVLANSDAEKYLLRCTAELVLKRVYYESAVWLLYLSA